MTIGVIWKCRCMPIEQTVAVPERRADEDLGNWMELCLQPAVYLAHRTLAPKCAATTMEYAKLPFDEGESLGTRRKVN